MKRPKTYAETPTPSDQSASFGDVEVVIDAPVQISVNGRMMTFGHGTWHLNESVARAIVASDRNRKAYIVEKVAEDE